MDKPNNLNKPSKIIGKRQNPFEKWANICLVYLTVVLSENFDAKLHPNFCPSASNTVQNRINPIENHKSN